MKIGGFCPVRRMFEGGFFISFVVDRGVYGIKLVLIEGILPSLMS